MTTTRPPVLIREADVGEHFEGIIGLYRAHGWTHAGDPDRLRIAIECSSFAVVALEDERVVGFARAMSDEAFAVYIADILVSPDRQRQGIGRTMTEAILEHYPMDRFHHQVLVAERGAEGFYRRLGMVPVTSYGLTAFIRARR
jgi:GNAT superfamily N-acetyltransferase